MRSTFQPCLPTIGKAVPATDAWLHEIKYDGYRLIVQRDGDRVRLFIRNDHAWVRSLSLDQGRRSANIPVGSTSYPI